MRSKEVHDLLERIPSPLCSPPRSRYFGSGDGTEPSHVGQFGPMRTPGSARRYVHLLMIALLAVTFLILLLTSVH